MHDTFKTLILSLAGCAAMTAAADELDAVLAQARAAIADEATLRAVKSLHYSGTVINAEGQPTGKLELYFKKPNRQRIELSADGVTEITCVNGYEGWIQRLHETDPAQQGLFILQAPQIEQLIHNARENLYFFHGPRHHRGGRIEYGGSERHEGASVHRVYFHYPRGTSYIRIFDADSGKLHATFTADNGLKMVESERMEVDGIQFPRVVRTYQDGELQRIVEFDKIQVNAPLDDALFDFPEWRPEPRR